LRLLYCCRRAETDIAGSVDRSAIEGAFHRSTGEFQLSGMGKGASHQR
jgi:hypothetical protein